ncbi:MAG: VanZ family protein [Massilibacteroides sp.]|nr:VanZ family protein [Massilibacteroides sp.]MDD3063801.1 VanZ family protein [Massilibacteroides sp.]MDD4116346.1 VanZ family protein [Massilibacteroides sp.]MDD4661267.1 VanZ family protein [Massilibacteroides sp.]
MLYFLMKYPFSLLITATVVYLSFFHPPSIGVPLVPYFDKIVHFGMYGGLSGMLWLEFLRNHRNNSSPDLRHAWIGAVVCPIIFSGGIELIQKHFTSYRGGEWADFFANTAGVAVATLIAYCLLRPLILKK